MIRTLSLLLIGAGAGVAVDAAWAGRYWLLRIDWPRNWTVDE